MECSNGCAWCQELLFIITSIFMIMGGVFTLGFFGDLVSYHRVLLPVALLIACGVLGCIVCFVVHLQRFNGAEQSRWLLVLTGAFYICCGIGCYVYLAFYASLSMHVGKMDAYLTEIEHKEMIDKTQIMFECCGDISYTDWFMVDWQGTDIEPIGDCNVESIIISRASVPYSCCSPDAASPCIHDYLQQDQDSRLYRGGCKQTLVAFSALFSLILGLLLLILGVLMLLWAFFATDDYCDEDCECDYEYEDKISILMPPNKTQAEEESPSEVAVQMLEEPSAMSNKWVAAGESALYRSPEERNLEALKEHERALYEISPTGYIKSKSALSSGTVIESMYSDSDSDPESDSSESA